MVLKNYTLKDRPKQKIQGNTAKKGHIVKDQEPKEMYKPELEGNKLPYYFNKYTSMKCFIKKKYIYEYETSLPSAVYV